MKSRMSFALVGMVFGLLGTMCTAACTPAEQQLARDVIDLTTAQCLMQHAEDPTVDKICHWETTKADVVKQLIGTQKDVLSRARTDFAAQRTAPCDGKR
jgi:hypothetical protein